MLLEGLDGQEQQRAGDELRDLLAGFAGGRSTAVGQGAVALAGDVGIHAETGARQPGKWATSRSASRPAGLPGRMARQWTSPAGRSAATAPGTRGRVLPPGRKAQPGAPVRRTLERACRKRRRGAAWMAPSTWTGASGSAVGVSQAGERIAPPELVGREAELRELAAYCTEPDRGPYVWWQEPRGRASRR